MPKNTFQRPQPVNHDHKVPRHGKQAGVPAPAKRGERGPAEPAAALPPLDLLLSRQPPRR